MQYPRINGITWDFSCVEVDADGQTFKDFEEVSYSHDCEPGEARGTRQQALGTTPGEYKAEGSLTMLLDAWEEWVVQLGDGYMDVIFPLIITREEGDLSVTDELTSCTIDDADMSDANGPDASEVKVTLGVLDIRVNGLQAIAS